MLGRGRSTALTYTLEIPSFRGCKDIRGLLAEAIMCFTYTTTTPFPSSTPALFHPFSSQLPPALKDPFKTACCLVKVAAGNAMAKAAGKKSGKPKRNLGLSYKMQPFLLDFSIFLFSTTHTHTSLGELSKLNTFFNIIFLKMKKFAFRCTPEDVYKIHFNNVECLISGTPSRHSLPFRWREIAS